MSQIPEFYVLNRITTKQATLSAEKVTLFVSQIKCHIEKMDFLVSLFSTSHLKSTSSTYDWIHERIDLYSENLPIEVQNKKTSINALIKHLVRVYHFFKLNHMYLLVTNTTNNIFFRKITRKRVHVRSSSRSPTNTFRYV